MHRRSRPRMATKSCVGSDLPRSDRCARPRQTSCTPRGPEVQTDLGRRTMTMARAAIFAVLALGICVAPMAACAQAPMGPSPQIQATQTFLMTWGGQKWDEMKTVTADKVTVKVGPGVYTLEPA